MFFVIFQELDEPISNILQVSEPPESTARVVYSYKDGSFVPYTNSLPFITLIELNTTLVHRESTNINALSGRDFTLYLNLIHFCYRIFQNIHDIYMPDVL